MKHSSLNLTKKERRYDSERQSGWEVEPWEVGVWETGKFYGNKNDQSALDVIMKCVTMYNNIVMKIKMYLDNDYV